MDKKLLTIQETAFNFFNDFTNLDENSDGYGLTIDNTNNLEKASIATTGFTLSSYIIADKYKYLNRDEIIKRIINTLKTLYYNVDHYEGFFAHFVDIKTAKRYRRSEYSTIDTALALNGIIAVASYFDNEEINKYSDLIIKRVNWRKFFHYKDDKLTLYMAYNDNPEGDYANGQAGFIHHWQMFAEQLMMYIIIAGDNRYTKEESLELYNSFDRIWGEYRGHKYIYSPGNTLFIYQFPLAWLDLENIYDNNNISWFNNAKEATLSQYAWARSKDNTYKSFGKHMFGMTAADTPKGYSVFHALPNINNKVLTDGSVAAHAALGSLPITPEISLLATKEMFEIKDYWNDYYGFYDSFNFENESWISNRFYGINKGLEMLMVNAYLTKDVQNAYMKHPLIIDGMRNLQWKRK